MVDFAYKESYDMNDFIKIIALLRSPDGCPWDREQTHGSIKRNFLEEAYEVCEAIDLNDETLLCEELGDVLMQVLFHSRIEEEAGRFCINDVADSACKKLIRRHPHVFAGLAVSGSEEVLSNWEDIKQSEKPGKTGRQTICDVTKNLPALWRAEKIQKRAARAGFDRQDKAAAADRLAEGTDRLLKSVYAGEIRRAEEDFGDLMFSAVNLARFSEIDPEEALHRSCERFILSLRSAEDEDRKPGAGLENIP